jgi:hypothetical protein
MMTTIFGFWAGCAVAGAAAITIAADDATRPSRIILIKLIVALLAVWFLATAQKGLAADASQSHRAFIVKN